MDEYIEEENEKDMKSAAAKILLIMGSHSAEWVSSESGVSKNTIYRILNRDTSHMPNLSTRNRIYLRFNIDIFSK